MRDDESWGEHPPRSEEPRETDSTPTEPVRASRTASFVFTATASEYFRIWIVNVCLSLVTLGIYSAWAKVRITRYVRGHTLLDGMPFTYDARPMAILRGRLLAAVLFGIWVGLAYVSPFAQVFALLPLVFIVPWLVVVSLSFNARVTSFRNVGFDFRGDYQSALGGYVGPLIGASLSASLLWPWALQHQRSWQAQQTYWGGLQLRLRTTVGEFYRAHVPTIMCVVVFFSFFFALAVSGTLEVSTESNAPSPSFYGMAALGYAFVGLGGLLTYTLILRAVLDGLSVGESIHLTCSLVPVRYAWILASNAVVSVLSLGMLYPWAEVRRLKYLSSCTRVHGVEHFDAVVGERAAARTAAGEEIADAFGFDLGF